ncbi:flagellar hook-associated protein FlgK [Roseomonas sp. CCTCC AB2023176]|uniref:flagellar hook-associated protein FlgK n=1 Tax=Roseomonas sp. CCTCC AB2023176 TaxID=3342640 RepID=UPI0035DC1CCC
MSLDLALSIARSGLSHVQRQIGTAAGNVANAGTTGYTRKVVDGAASDGGGLAFGVRSLEARRDVDAAMTAALNAARATGAAAEARAALLRDVELAHGRPEAGESVGDLANALRDTLLSAREEPADGLRQSAVVDAADEVAQRLNTVSAAIGGARQSAQDGLVEGVAALNAGLRRVAELNERIRPLKASGQSTAALEDQRDLAVAGLSDLMELRVIPQADGSVGLLGRGGIALTLDTKGDVFSIASATAGPSAYHGGAGTLPGVMIGTTDVTGALGNGRLGALVEMRDRTLPLMQAELDVAAANLASRFDAQGLRLFTGSAGTVPDPTTPYAGGGWIDFATAIRVNPAVRADPRLVRDGTHAVSATPGGPTAFAPNPSGGPAAFTTALDRALNHALGAQGAPGSTQPPFATTGLGPAGNLSSPIGSGGGLAAFAASLVARQTGMRAAAEEGGEAAKALRTTLEERVAKHSGVDMDQEMAGMVSLQNAYAANARILSTVQAMYDALLGAVR